MEEPREPNLERLTLDQQQRIEATLQRIRRGLNDHSDLLEEPAHVFLPEAYNNDPA